MFSSGVLYQYKQRCSVAFGSGTTTATTATIPIVIPKDYKYISFLLAGAGGGAAGGASGSAGTSRRGGGGGSSGSIMSATYQTILLPEVVYLHLSGGGLGGNANSSGNGSVASYVSISAEKSTSANHILMLANSGSQGNVSGAGASAPSAYIISPNNLCVLFPNTIFSIVGLAGANSANATSPVNSTIIPGILSNSTGGASTNTSTSYAGPGLVTGSTAGANIFNLPASTVVATGGNINGGDGINGMDNLQNCNLISSASTPLFSLPGTGGGSIDSGTGGKGGNGGPGNGGSGGGAGTTGGKGGNGGPAFCITTMW